MAKDSPVFCYRSGPIEKDPAASLHAKNIMDSEFKALGIEIIGDTFDILTRAGTPQAVYGPQMKKLRDQGKFYEYCQKEKLLKPSFRYVRKSTFMVVRPSPEGSGGTTSETVVSWLKMVPKLVIIGPHGEGLLDNSSTFVIRMLTDYYSLVFGTEKEVVDFVKKNFEIFKQGREAVRRLIAIIKLLNPCINDRSKPLSSDVFGGKTVIIHGRPGAGKGTQARMLQDLAGFKYFGSGHELRRLSNKIPALAESLGKGNLAPDVVIHYLLAQSILKLEKFEPIAIDGSPKKLAEAKGLLDLLNFLGRKPVVIVLDIDENLSRERIVLRRNCDHCELSFCAPELTDGSSCPNCGAAMTVRPENADPAAIEKIMKWYETDVREAIGFFENNGLVTHIDGNRKKEEVFRDILEILKKQRS